MRALLRLFLRIIFWRPRKTVPLAEYLDLAALATTQAAELDTARQNINTLRNSNEAAADRLEVCKDMVQWYANNADRDQERWDALVSRTKDI
jgi:hypothetical protein